jgi:uncharacterized protein (TIGR00730 family)
MSQPFRVCVFGSSSKNTNHRYVAEAVKLGEVLAQRGMLCVNGAGSTGCMGGVNKGCEMHGGLIRGVIHEKFCVDFGEHPLIKDLIMVKGADLSERKQALLDHSDCIVVLPGGVGTFDELWDCICGKSLGMKGMDHKPICVVNIDGFYDGFIMQLRRAYRDGILYGPAETYFHVETDSILALDWCQKVFQEGLAERSAASLMDNIKLNNIEERVKERKTTVQVITEQTLKVEEIVLESFLDYKNVALAFVVGIIFGGMVQHLVTSTFF